MGFDFPGRNGAYSSLKYHWQHFNGTDHIVKGDETQTGDIYLIVGDGDKSWAPDVCLEKGNHDFLMFVNIDFANQEVRTDLKNWVEWLKNELPIGGIRLDAVKHCSRAFLMEFFNHIAQHFGHSWFNVGEYWESNVNELLEFLRLMEKGLVHNKIHLFDVPLVTNFSEISKQDEGDLRQILKNTLVSERPDCAVVRNIGDCLLVLQADTLSADFCG